LIAESETQQYCQNAKNNIVIDSFVRIFVSSLEPLTNLTTCIILYL